MNKRRRMTGVVTSDKMMKTVVVEVSRTYQHPLYKKVVHASSRFKAHNELDARTGDLVEIVESRPLSRDKRWVVEKIVRRQGESAVPAPFEAQVEAETLQVMMPKAQEPEEEEVPEEELPQAEEPQVQAPEAEAPEVEAPESESADSDTAEGE